MRGNHEKSLSMEGQVLLDRKFQIMPLMEGRILFDPGRVKLAPPTRIILLSILFIFVFPLFHLSAQEQKDTTVNAIKGSTVQDGIVNEGEAKKFVADKIESIGNAPTRVIKLKKKFTPPSPFKFRVFKDPEEVNYTNISFIRHDRKDPRYWYLAPNNRWRYWVGKINSFNEILLGCEGRRWN